MYCDRARDASEWAPRSSRAGSTTSWTPTSDGRSHFHDIQIIALVSIGSRAFSSITAHPPLQHCWRPRRTSSAAGQRRVHERPFAVPLHVPMVSTKARRKEEHEEVHAGISTRRKPVRSTSPRIGENQSPVSWTPPGDRGFG